MIHINEHASFEKYAIFTDAICRFSDGIYAHGASAELQKAFLDSFSRGQMDSKKMVLKILADHGQQFKTAVFVGQWNGLLPYLLHVEKYVESAIGIERSELWSMISKRVNRDWDWKSVTGDACDSISWEGKNPEIVVNTAAEHMSDHWLQFVKANTFILVQSTNYQIEEHVNRVESLDELTARLKLNRVIKTAEQEFKMYKRFTVFGQK